MLHIYVKTKNVLFMKRLFLLLSLPVFIFSSCKKEVTEVQQVDQAFSAVYTINASDWKTTNNGKSYSAELDVPELDNIIYQDGAVLVYLSFSGTSYYEALPQVFDGITYGAVHGSGYVSIDMSAIDGANINPPGQPVSAKIILIDATRLALKKDINLKDMQAVEKAFNIKN
ncbi:MAG: hypothetical protein BGP13_10105 [Sphingobacteriales bacterium 40-81]|nr:MAG: hypothetical protein BGP13_10105 [Sphingobacteriales bacterium 40-81]